VPSERSDVNRAQLLVFVEGLRTEVQYINFWYRMNRAQVLVDIDERHGTPMTLVNAALDAKRAEQREERRNRGKAHDEYWCVFDRDEHPQFDEAVKLARENGIGIAMSTPAWSCGSYGTSPTTPLTLSVTSCSVALRSISAVARASRMRLWRSSPRAGGMTPRRSAR
jgi:RloB-like protein